MYQGELYPSLRLLDGAKRLTESIISSGGFEGESWPHSFVERCEEGFGLLMTDQETFVEFISDSTRMLAIEMKKRSIRGVGLWKSRGLKARILAYC